MSQSGLVLSELTGDYWVSSRVKVLHNPSKIEFLREAVCSYEPVIIKGIINHWPALLKWKTDLIYIEQNSPETVQVNVTPDGLGDSVKIETSEDGNTKRLFTYPAEIDMKMRDFCSMMTHPHHDDAVPYLSEQNDNLKRRFPNLLLDIDPSLSLCDEVFSPGENVPEAVNLWVGDERSVSSVHKDHFENLYCVVAGEKTFTLLPPTDIAFMREEQFECRRYMLRSPVDELSSTGRIKRDELVLQHSPSDPTSLPWIDLDPNTGPAERRHALQCTVQAGEVLYIPAMWYHRVSQTRLTIAVNYWYDQRFDFRLAIGMYGVFLIILFHY